MRVTYNNEIKRMGFLPQDRGIRKNCIDMHVHTSTGRKDDGRFLVSLIVQAARFLSLDYIALTPHAYLDNLEGVRAADQIDQGVCPGIELHVETGKFLFHILGFFNPSSYNLELEIAFNRELQLLEQKREKYLKALTLNVNREYNTHLDFEKVKIFFDNFGGGFADAVSKTLKLHYMDIDFERFDVLDIDYGMTPKYIVELIHAFGGKSVLAHPRWMYPKMRSILNVIRTNLLNFFEREKIIYPNKMTFSELYVWLEHNYPDKFTEFQIKTSKIWLAELYKIIEEEIIPTGITAIETHTSMTELPNYPAYKAVYAQVDQQLIARYNLNETAGTDYHGGNAGEPQLGTGINFTFQHPVSMINWLLNK